jgi:hypothetical protein
MNISAEHRNELTGNDGRLVNIDLAAQLRLMQHFADGLDRPLRTVFPIPRVASRNSVTRCLIKDVTKPWPRVSSGLFSSRKTRRSIWRRAAEAGEREFGPRHARRLCFFASIEPPRGEGDMVTRRAGGNISGEATTPSGNIFLEAMRGA